jgi:hypothetical protein
MDMKKNYFLAACLLLAACSSKELTENQAQDMIVKKLALPEFLTTEIYTGDPTDAVRVKDTELERRGFLRYVPKPEEGHRYVEFGDSSQLFVRPNAQNRIESVKTFRAARQEIKVVSMHFNDAKTGATAQYVLLYKDITPFSELVQGDLKKERSNTAHFILKNNQWEFEDEDVGLTSN